MGVKLNIRESLNAPDFYFDNNIYILKIKIDYKFNIIDDVCEFILIKTFC